MRSVVRHLSPAWFSAVMGTGIVAVVGARLTLPGVRVLSVAVGVLAAVLLVVLLLGSALHWRWFPRTAAGEVSDTSSRPFAGSPSIALLTVSSVVGALAPAWTPVQAGLWAAGTAVAAVTALAVPLSLLSEGDTDVAPAWLLPAAPPLVAASTGATLVAKAPEGEPRLLLLGLCVAMAGAVLLLALVLTVLVVGRTNRGGGLHGQAEPPVWIVLGVLAQGVVAVLLLGGQAEEVLPGRAVAGASLLLATGLNRPGMSGDSEPWEGWGHGREHVEEVPVGAEGSGGADGRGGPG